VGGGGTLVWEPVRVGAPFSPSLEPPQAGCSLRDPALSMVSALLPKLQAIHPLSHPSCPCPTSFDYWWN
jgi:hypothetical protein